MRDPERAATGPSPGSGSATRAQYEGCRCGGPPPDRGEVAFTESEETELAVELLAVRDPRQFDRFLGGLIQRAARAAGGVGASRLGRALGGILKGVARSALPASGVAVGALAPSGRAPAVGESPFESEAESLAEDREFEAARRFVRFAGAAARRAARAPAGAPPGRAVRDAVVSAARRHAPRLLRRRRRWPRPVIQPVIHTPSEPSIDIDTASEPPAPVCGEPSVETCSCGRLIRHGRKVVVINL
jgi:hypothetical protein